MLSNIFLGIDPGLVKTGWGIVEKCGYDIKYKACGVIKTEPQKRMEERLILIYSSVSEIITKFKPAKISMEKVFVNKNPESSQKLIMARTAAFLSAAQFGYAIDEYSANEIKKNITGQGHSSKNQIYVMIQKILGIKLSIDNRLITSDAIDAIAIALCNAFKNQF